MYIITPVAIESIGIEQRTAFDTILIYLLSFFTFIQHFIHVRLFALRIWRLFWNITCLIITKIHLRRSRDVLIFKIYILYMFFVKLSSLISLTWHIISHSTFINRYILRIWNKFIALHYLRVWFNWFGFSSRHLDSHPDVQ